MNRTESLPKSLQVQLEQYFGDLNLIRTHFPQTQDAIVRISDHFQNRVRVTPWEKTHFREAYFVYFHTLNVLRLKAVFKELSRWHPQFCPNHIFDFGSGLGASELAFREVFTDCSSPWTFIESNREAERLHSRIRPQSWCSNVDWTRQIPAFPQESLLISSYSLNELNEFPTEFLNAETIIIVEPSTQAITRRLMALREPLSDSGFHLLAPCTHSMQCPLLKESKKDWCYDRIHWERPKWFEALEAQLPMTNRTLTFSYLIASRTLKPQKLEKSARVIGDTLKEKGKSRQMICRGEEREFLSWLKRDGAPQPIPHGSLVELPDEIESKGKELRCQTQNIKII